MNEQPTKNQVPAVPYSAVCSIEIGGGFFARTQELLMYHLGTKTPEESAKAIEALKTEEPTDPWSYHALTIITLISDITKAMKDQGKMTMMDAPDKPS